jgi:hypothetical protein
MDRNVAAKSVSIKYMNMPLFQLNILTINRRLSGADGGLESEAFQNESY